MLKYKLVKMSAPQISTVEHRILSLQDVKFKNDEDPKGAAK